MKKLSVLVVIFSLLLITCGGENNNNNSLPSMKFWAQNFSSSEFYQVDAQLLAENDLCYVWAEKGSGVTEDIAQNVADSYKKDIYYKMLATFGDDIDLIDTNGNIVKTLNTVQLANWLAKGEAGDGKFTILLMDIKDSFQQGVNDSYVAGYFWAGNLLNMQYSNKCDMIYVDINPGIPGSRESNETLAHEMQHMMNFVSTVVCRSIQVDGILYISLMDTWIDEGLSSAAEWLYLEEHPEFKWKWYNLNGDGEGLIDKGNNFFVWGNREDVTPYAILDDYSTVYLFFQWLRLQTGNTAIYKSIITSEDYDFNAVTNAIDEEIPDKGYSDWEVLLETWLAANHINAETGAYGYKNDSVLKNIKAPAAPGGNTSIILYPGEGVYSSVTSSTPIPAAAGNIKYAGLDGSAPLSSGSISSGVLLTYNANKINAIKDEDGNATEETGAITGNPPSANIVSVLSGGRSIGIKAGPFPISAGDMLRRNGKNGSFNSGGLNFNIPSSYKGIKVNEK